MKLFQIVLIIVLIVLFWMWMTSSPKDHYGQDPSIRASAGWVAGPIYGYDPIAQFAEEIREMDAREAAKREASKQEHFCAACL